MKIVELWNLYLARCEFVGHRENFPQGENTARRVIIMRELKGTLPISLGKAKADQWVLGCAVVISASLQIRFTVSLMEMKFQARD